MITFLLAMLIPPGPAQPAQIPVVRIEYDKQEICTNDFFVFTPIAKDVNVEWFAQGPAGNRLNMVSLGPNKQVMTGELPGTMTIHAKFSLTRHINLVHFGYRINLDVPVELELVVGEIELKPYNPPLVK